MSALGAAPREALVSRARLLARAGLVWHGVEAAVALAAGIAAGWWWADPVAALAIAAVAVHEGREAWRGEDACCAH